MAEKNESAFIQQQAVISAIAQRIRDYDLLINK
jgi:hypothetical protein